MVMAEPAASLAGELRRMIPELRALVGDDRRVLVGFDRGGWSPALFADLHAAGFDTLTWRTGAALDIEAAACAALPKRSAWCQRLPSSTRSIYALTNSRPHRDEATHIASVRLCPGRDRGEQAMEGL